MLEVSVKRDYNRHMGPIQSPRGAHLTEAYWTQIESLGKQKQYQRRPQKLTPDCLKEILSKTDIVAFYRGAEDTL